MSGPELAAVANANSGPAVALTSVSRHFGRFAALRAVTADFAPARVYTVLGENGAGKSTMLRLIAGLLPPTSGAINVLGSNDVREVRHRLGLMEHAPLLYDELDGMENLRYFAGLYGIKDDAVCAGVMRMVGLDPELKRRVGQYSQGMRQRLSLGRAVLHGPELLLLDEPFANVDAGTTREMVRLLGQMRDGGRTVLVVTHQPALLEAATDEFVHMAAGRIVARTRTLAQEVAPAPPPAGPVESAKCRGPAGGGAGATANVEVQR